MGMFPDLAILNRYLLGDTVLTEPIATAMGIDKRVYVICNYPEVFYGHPSVIGVRGQNELPSGTRVIDLSDSIRSLENGEVIPNKFSNMCKQAGFDHVLDAPKIYLRTGEYKLVQDVRAWYDGYNIGVILESKHKGKNWVHILKCIRRLVKSRYNVFIIAEHIDPELKLRLPKGIHFITNLKIRDLILRIAMMDVVIGPDTGPLHIGGALGIPTVVVCFPIFSDLHDIYPNTIPLPSDNFTLDEGIRGISVQNMIDAIEKSISIPKRISVIPPKKAEKIVHTLFIRMRGIGDIYLSLPAIAAGGIKQNTNEYNTFTYMTSPVGKTILDNTTIFDNVIGIKYDHATSGYPLPPPDGDYDIYGTITNMINTIDFLPDSNKVPRTELFARAIGVEEIDYDLPGWKIPAPQEWREAAHKLLLEYGVTPGDKVLALQTDTMGRSRTWPKARQIDFCGKALARGYKVVLLSDKNRSHYPKRCINLTGETSIPEYIGIIANANVCVSPDSAMIHIAGAMDKLCIGLFGAVDPELRIAHYNTIHPIVGVSKQCRQNGEHQFCNDWQDGNCSQRKKTPECMWSITATQIFDKLQSVLTGGSHG